MIYYVTQWYFDQHRNVDWKNVPFAVKIADMLREKKNVIKNNYHNSMIFKSVRKTRTGKLKILRWEKNDQNWPKVKHLEWLLLDEIASRLTSKVTRTKMIDHSLNTNHRNSYNDSNKLVQGIIYWSANKRTLCIHHQVWYSLIWGNNNRDRDKAPHTYTW